MTDYKKRNYIVGLIFIIISIAVYYFNLLGIFSFMISIICMAVGFFGLILPTFLGHKM